MIHNVLSNVSSMILYVILIMNNDIIIRKFDEALQQKSSKIRVDEIWNHIQQNCSDKGEQDEFMNATSTYQKEMNVVYA